MKSKFIISSLILFTLFSTNSFAQFNPYSDKVKMLSAGLGISGWGIPVYVRFELPVANNITVGGVLSYQSKGYNSSVYNYRVSYFGISARGSYHFNELLDASDDWDFYAGASIGYFFASFSGDDFFGSSGLWGNSVSLGAHVGARYFINEKIAINAEAGGGSAVGGATIGVTFML